MRTTLAIDDDVLVAAKHLADRDRKTLGEVISALARSSLNKPATSRTNRRNGIALLPRHAAGTPVSMELVNQLRDELP